MPTTMPTRVVIRGQRTEETNPTKERDGGKQPKEEDCDIRGVAPPKIRESDTCGEKGWIEPKPQCVTVVEPLCDHTAKKVIDKGTHGDKGGGEEVLVQAHIKRGREAKDVDRSQ